MDPMFEQASAFLDQAILSYSGGQIEAACEQMAAAAAVLRQVQLAAPQPETAAISTLDLELATVAVCEVPMAVPKPPLVTAIQPVQLEPAPEPSIAVAA